MIKTCVICGKQFDATRAKKTCSKECSYELEKRSDLKAAKSANERRNQKRAALRGWLTIPKAPSYEINKQLQVRNKRTKYMPKLYYNPTTNSYFHCLFTQNGKRINLTPQAAYNQAVAAALGEDGFMPIPNYCGRYEINKFGIVRNIKTKRILKQHKCPGGGIWYILLPTADRKKHTRRFVDSLLAEVFGIHNKHRQTHQPVILTKGDRRIFFESFATAARFLATQYFYQPGSLAARMKKRKPVIEDWQVTYLNEDNNSYMRHLNRIAHQQQKAEASPP